MNTSALIIMLTVWSLVTTLTIYFIAKLLKRSKMNSYYLTSLIQLTKLQYYEIFFNLNSGETMRITLMILILLLILYRLFATHPLPKESIPDYFLELISDCKKQSVILLMIFLLSRFNKKGEESQSSSNMKS